MMVPSKDTNVALGRPTRQSSGGGEFARPGAATDGVFTGRFSFHTDLDSAPWLEIDLQSVTPLRSIVVWNRGDTAEGGAQRAVPLRVESSRDGVAWTSLCFTAAPFGATSFGEPLVIRSRIPMIARFLKFQVMRESYLHLDQIQAFLSLPDLSFAEVTSLRPQEGRLGAAVAMRHDSGFFSVCSATLETVARLGAWGIEVESIDTRATHSTSRDDAGPADVHAALFGPRRDVTPPDLEDTLISNGPFSASHCHFHYRDLQFRLLAPFVERHFAPTRTVTDEEQRLMARFGLDPDRLVALYYRGTDKSQEVRPTEIERYIEVAERCLSADPDRRLLVQTDQQQIRDRVAAHFGSRCVWFDDLPVTAGQSSLHVPALDLQAVHGIGRFEMTLRLLASVRIMARAREVILCSSNVSLWVALFRGSARGLWQFDAAQDLVAA